MKHAFFSTSFVVIALALSGCANQAAAPHAEAPQPAAALGGPAARVVEFPGEPGAGEPREVSKLVDEPALKLVTIVLRAGTVLPSHDTAVPATIVALRGSGTVVAGTERLRLDATHAVVLAPGVAHSVEPDAGTDLVLLVHHLGRGKESHQSHESHHP